MDPSIMKLLEDDEDETMHSGADVEAFTAALNRDIEGDTSTSSQPFESDGVVLSQGGHHTSSQFLPQWQTSSQDEITNNQSHQSREQPNILQQHEQPTSEMEPKQHNSGDESRQQQIDTSQEINDLTLLPKQSQDDQWKQQAEQIPFQYSQPLSLQPKQLQDDHRQQQVAQISHQFSQPTGVQISENSILMRDQGRMHNPDNDPHFLRLQRMNIQPVATTDQASNPPNRTKQVPSKQVPFGLLLPVITPQLDKDRAMQLHTLYNKLKKNEIPKEGFVRHMKAIVGDQMLKLAVMKMHAQLQQNPSQAAVQQPNLKMAPSNATQFTEPQQFAQFHQKGQSSPADPSHFASSTEQVKGGSSYVALENSAQKSRELERQSDSHGMQVSQMASSISNKTSQDKDHSTTPIQGLNKQNQQHVHFPSTSFPMYGSSGGTYHPYSGTDVNTSVSSFKPQAHDSHMRQVPLNQNMGSTQVGGSTQAMNMTSVPKFERQNVVNDSMRLQGGPFAHLKNNSTLNQNSVPWQSAINKEQSNGASSSMSYVKQEPVDQGNEQQHKSQLSTSHVLSSISALKVEQGNSIAGALMDEFTEKQSSRVSIPSSMSMVTSNSVSSSMTTQLDPNVSLGSRVPSTISPVGVNAKTPPKKPSIGQKKPLEGLVSSPPLSSKKQKVSGTFSDQSIEQLNDVTAVSGVNLREEEEQLFSGPKEDSRASEASRRFVQEEEERLILQKAPLQKKLEQIMAKCGIDKKNKDVERCLSLCVEERIRGLINNLIRMSKQRVDADKARHQTVITSDVRHQILLMNRKAREEWERKQAEAEKLRKLSEPEDNNGTDGDKEKDDGRGKALKVNKEEDDKMRTTAANVAARAAVGGDDMLSKWQLMAEQARQKREGATDGPSSSQPSKDTHKPSASSGKSLKDNQEQEKRGHSVAITASGALRKMGKNQVIVPQTRVTRNISVKDVIAVLEREPQMCKSTLIYRLYDKMRSEASVDTPRLE